MQPREQKKVQRTMRKTFECSESMIITIPIGNLKCVDAGQLMPEKFSCVFRDTYKVFVHNGKPKPLGAVQAITGVFLCSFGLIMTGIYKTYTLPSVLFVVSGLLTYAAGKAPNMHMAKLSFSLNIISFFWSIAAFAVEMLVTVTEHGDKVNKGVSGLIMSLLVLENVVALFMIYWLSKAVCRQHFNTLPIIMLKHGE